MKGDLKYDIFLSYPISDSDHVGRIARYLDNIGLSVWLDKWYIVPGQQWKDQIKRAIERSYIIGAFISSSSSGWQREELEFALHEHEQEEFIRVIPILLPGTTVECVPPALRNLTFIDLRDDLPEPEQLSRLIAAIVDANQSIGDSFRKLGEYRKATFHYRRALEVGRKILGDGHPSTLTSMTRLALTLQDQGELEKARAIQEEVLEMSRRILGDKHPDTLTSMSNIAATLSYQGDLDGAREIQETVLKTTRQILGDKHPSTSISAWNLFTTLREIGDSAGSVKVLESDLLWLLDHDSASLGADQQKIREMILQIREKP